MNFKPYHDRVLVKPLPEETRTAGGLYIPDQAKEKPARGLVIAVGPGRLEGDKRIATMAQVDDTVLYGKYSGTEVKVGGEAHMLLRDDEVLGCFEEEG